MGRTWLAVPRELVASFGEMCRFFARVAVQISSLRVLRFFGEALRQAGILILGSTVVIWGLVFIIGLECGIEGAYFTRAQGTPAYAGVFAAWCDLRELVPYAFGYMLAAKVGTGLVAEIGSMRISDEIDALEVMGVDSVLFLCATRLLASWLVLPFDLPERHRRWVLRELPGDVQQIGDVSSGGFFLIFWMFQNPPDLVYSVVKAMVMATFIVLVGCDYGYHVRGGPVGVGTATAKSMVLNLILIHVIGMLGTQLFWERTRALRSAADDGRPSRFPGRSRRANGRPTAGHSPCRRATCAGWWCVCLLGPDRDGLGGRRLCANPVDLHDLQLIPRVDQVLDREGATFRGHCDLAEATAAGSQVHGESHGPGRRRQTYLDGGAAGRDDLRGLRGRDRLAVAQPRVLDAVVVVVVVGVALERRRPARRGLAGLRGLAGRRRRAGGVAAAARRRTGTRLTGFSDSAALSGDSPALLTALTLKACDTPLARSLMVAATSVVVTTGLPSTYTRSRRRRRRPAAIVPFSVIDNTQTTL